MMTDKLLKKDVSADDFITAAMILKRKLFQKHIVEFGYTGYLPVPIIDHL